MLVTALRLFLTGWCWWLFLYVGVNFYIFIRHQHRKVVTNWFRHQHRCIRLNFWLGLFTWSESFLRHLLLRHLTTSNIRRSGSRGLEKNFANIFNGRVHDHPIYMRNFECMITWSPSKNNFEDWNSFRLLEEDRVVPSFWSSEREFSFDINICLYC